MVNYLTQEEYENQLMIHQFSNNASEIMVNNESDQQTDLGRKYELRSRQVPISAPNKQNLGRKIINQLAPPTKRPIPVSN